VGQRSDDHLDLAGARAVLDADHHGLDEVKDRIVEELAVRKLRRAGGSTGPPPPEAPRPPSTVITLVGPPGVGKTSLGESIARALGRNFVRVALGGVRDEAEIRGHRRTYVGSQPGRIVGHHRGRHHEPRRAARRGRQAGPGDYRGDPSAALLEVLDPAQNHTFRDHYLEVDLDLSEVIFIATANQPTPSPARCSTAWTWSRLDGYTEDEKVAIAQTTCCPASSTGPGSPPTRSRVTDDALRAIVSGYTREAGVRSLERSWASWSARWRRRWQRA
jgi:ATP-dependent Lon protease